MFVVGWFYDDALSGCDRETDLETVLCDVGGLFVIFGLEQTTYLLEGASRFVCKLICYF